MDSELFRNFNLFSNHENIDDLDGRMLSRGGMEAAGDGRLRSAIRKSYL